MNLAVASTLTLPALMVLFVLGQRSLGELDIVAMLVLGILGMRQAAASSDSRWLTVLIALPAVLIGGLLTFGLVALFVLLHVLH